MEREKVDVLELFDSRPYLKVCARWSGTVTVQNVSAKIRLRPLLHAHDYGRFLLSQRQGARQRVHDKRRRQSDDRPVRANTVADFIGAAAMVAPYSDGVDLNCGCPQRWAKQMGLGCALLDTPEVIADLVRTCRNRIAKPFTVSVKMRILKDLRRTVEIARQLEMAGVSFLSVHARTASQLTGDIDEEALKLVVENVDCPVVANGGVRSLTDCNNIHERTNCKGVMVANAILTNPTLFSGSNETTLDCVQNWLDICYNTTLPDYDKSHLRTIDSKPANLTFQCFHHHLVFMLEKYLPNGSAGYLITCRIFVMYLTSSMKNWGALKLLPLLLFKHSLRQLLVDLDRFWPHFNYKTVKKFATAYKYVCCSLFATLVVVGQYKQEFLLRCHVPDFPYAKNVLVALQSLNFCFDTCLIIVMDLYFFETCHFIKKQFDLLLGRLKDISEVRDFAEVSRDLREWKIHHDFLTRYTASIAKAYELYFLLKFIEYIVLFCTFIVVKPHSGSYFEPICREILLANQMILMYLLVAKVTDTAEEIADAVYSTNWYEWPLDVQKDLILIIQRAQTTPKFTAFGIVTINRKTITTVFQKTYSFYTIAKSVMDLKQASES